MKTEILLDYIKENKYHLDFDIDGVGMTWGISYVRFVIGDKHKFENIEHFFFSTLKSDRNMTSMIQGGKTWDERVDLTKWANGLTIKETSTSEVLSFTDFSIREINENEKNWQEENTIHTSNLDLPKNFDHCWILKETADARHYINSTEIYLASSRDKFFYIEGHWES